MDTQRAAEHLQVIRTLMERAALYRRALAPIMLSVGTLGIAAGIAGYSLKIEQMRGFGMFWLGIAVAAVAVAFLLARQQALKDREPFWSSPTRRVSQALMPALGSGLCFAVVFTISNDEEMLPFFVLLCLFFYGCAVHAAGFFMPRGMRLFGWIYIAGATLLLVMLFITETELTFPLGSMLMGSFFGVLQVAYGFYLRATEKREPVA